MRFFHRHLMQSISATDEHCSKCSKRKHSHIWQDSGTFEYIPPSDFEFGGGMMGPETREIMERATRGFTQWHQRCLGCGLVRYQSVYGKYRSEAEPKNQIGAFKGIIS